MILFRILVISFLCQVFVATGTSEKVPLSHCVRRLYRHVTFLQAVNAGSKKPVIKVDVMPIQCKHELMQWCIKKMHDEECIDALFDVWRTFTHHSTDSCLEDELFVRDFAALVYVIYMNIITIAVRGSFHDFMVLYNQVLVLPLPDLLDLLDIFYERLGVIFHAYAHSTLSYTDLIKQYWWAPLAIGAAIVTSVLKWYMRRPLHISPQ